MSVLYPDIAYGSDWQQAEVMCRPPAAGGCITLIRYDRFWSNWISEYDRTVRVIDRAKLVSDITLNDIYDPDRYLWAIKNGIMGVVEEQRLFFEGIVYPEKGMGCLEPQEPDLPGLADDIEDAGQ